MIELSGRVALVTGSSRGLGRAVATGLADAGADVAINFIENEKTARKTCEDVTPTGIRGIMVQVDVSKGNDISREKVKCTATISFTASVSRPG